MNGNNTKNNTLQTLKSYYGKPPKLTPLQVEVNGSFEDACSKFKSAYQKERVLTLVKEKSRYEKPSEKKRRKLRESNERVFKQKMREKLIESGEWEKIQKKRKVSKTVAGKKQDSNEQLR